MGGITLRKDEKRHKKVVENFTKYPIGNVIKDKKHTRLISQKRRILFIGTNRINIKVNGNL